MQSQVFTSGFENILICWFERFDDFAHCIDEQDLEMNDFLKTNLKNICSDRENYLAPTFEKSLNSLFKTYCTNLCGKYIPHDIKIKTDSSDNTFSQNILIGGALGGIIGLVIKHFREKKEKERMEKEMQEAAQRAALGHGMPLTPPGAFLNKV